MNTHHDLKNNDDQYYDTLIRTWYPVENENTFSYEDGLAIVTHVEYMNVLKQAEFTIGDIKRLHVEWITK